MSETPEENVVTTLDEVFAIVRNHLWHAKQAGVQTDPALAALDSIEAEVCSLGDEIDDLHQKLEATQSGEGG